MAQQTTRREILKSGLAAAGLGMLGIPEWAMPALAQGETLVEFTDLPEKIVLVPTADRRIIDIRHINGVLTPRDQFADDAALRPSAGGPRDLPAESLGAWSTSRCRSRSTTSSKMRSTDVVFGFECSGNRRPLQGLTGNGRWTGVSLKRVLDEAGLQEEAREIRVLWR